MKFTVLRKGVDVLTLKKMATGRDSNFSIRAYLIQLTTFRANQESIWYDRIILVGFVGEKYGKREPGILRWVLERDLR